MRLALPLLVLLACGPATKSDTADTAPTTSPTPTSLPTTSTPTGTTGTGASTTDDPLPVEPRRCTGFADAPESWGVEGHFLADFNMYSGDGRGDYWSLADLTGDGVPDSIEHAHASHEAAEAMGEAWHVWPGTGSGFGARVRWSLPLDHRELEGLHAANSVQTVLDLNGDGLADLVRARDPETADVFGGVDAPYWELYPGDGRSGFAREAVHWTLPVGLHLPSEVFEGRVHTVRDLDGDGQVELVNTYGPDGDNFGTGDSLHWRVHPADGEGFSEAYTEWPLPPARGLHGDWYPWVDSSSRWHTTLDVSGDGLPDLIAPKSNQFPFAVYGEDPDWHWRVHLNTGAGFEADHREWSIPDPFFDFPSEGVDSVYPTSTLWRTLSVGAGSPVLLIARDPDTGSGWTEGGDPIWALFDATGEGFADLHTGWTVPDPVFDRLYSTGGASGEGWFVRDMDADGCDDLVLTSGLDLGLPGDEPDWEWWVYRGR